MMQYFSCAKHMVEGYGRTTCKYCNDEEYDYKPYEAGNDRWYIVDGSRQTKTQKENEK